MIVLRIATVCDKVAGTEDTGALLGPALAVCGTYSDTDAAPLHSG